MSRFVDALRFDPFPTDSTMRDWVSERASRGCWLVLHHKHRHQFAVKQLFVKRKGDADHDSYRICLKVQPFLCVASATSHSEIMEALEVSLDLAGM